MKKGIIYRVSEEFQPKVWKGEAMSFYKNELEKGFLATKFKIEIGRLGDDFIKNFMTVLITYNVTKIPRFINPLHRK